MNRLKFKERKSYSSIVQIISRYRSSDSAQRRDVRAYCRLRD